MAKNKQLLLDTHIFLWWMQGSKKLSKKLVKVLKNPDNQVFISTASIWEMIIKKKLGKLKIPNNLKTILSKSGFEVLSISLDHVLELEKLPPLHKDPFDRILIAQAKTEHLILATNDKKNSRYEVLIIS